MSQDPFALLGHARTASLEIVRDTAGVTDKQRHEPASGPPAKGIEAPPRAKAHASRPKPVPTLALDEEREHISFHISRWVLRAVDEYRVRSASLTRSAPAPRAEILRALLEQGARTLGTREAFVRERRTSSER